MRNRDVVVWSDNKGAESAIRKGAGKQWDQNAIVHGIWAKAVRMQAGLWIGRVPSKDNPADPPAREDYALMQKLGAWWVKPALDPVFEEAQTWKAFSIA